MHLRKVNEEVYVAEDAIVHVGPDAVAFVKEQARKSQRGRARISTRLSRFTSSKAVSTWPSSTKTAR